jgi:DNA-binding MarR family transcriptional regulator
MADPPSGQEIAAVVRRVYHLLMFRLDSAVSGAFISFAQYEVLPLLERDPNIHAAAIARSLRVTRQTTHGLVRQLLRAPLVELLPVDGGVRGIELTREGEDRLEFAQGGADIGVADLDALPPEDRIQVDEALRLLEGQLRSKAGWYRQWG